MYMIAIFMGCDCIPPVHAGLLVVLGNSGAKHGTALKKVVRVIFPCTVSAAQGNFPAGISLGLHTPCRTPCRDFRESTPKWQNPYLGLDQTPVRQIGAPQFYLIPGWSGTYGLIGTLWVGLWPNPGFHPKLLSFPSSFSVNSLSSSGLVHNFCAFCACFAGTFLGLFDPRGNVQEWRNEQVQRRQAVRSCKLTYQSLCYLVQREDIAVISYRHKNSELTWSWQRFGFHI